MSAENIYLAGRYNKYLRNLSQSPWIDKDDVRVKDSVQEMIEDGLKKYLKFDKSTFASSGREDVDVRMLGRGRPFTFKIQNPQSLSDYNVGNLKTIQAFINSKYDGKVRVNDLQVVSKSDVSKYMTDIQESKQKEYRALCCCTRKLSIHDVEKINSFKNLIIQQLTPIRVLHRRTWATRKRTIYQMRIETVRLGEFDSVRENHLDRVFALVLTTEAGTYIKEFVHGDFGRTEPNLASLLGSDCETDLVELDVMEVYSDWPPELEKDSQLEKHVDVKSAGGSMDLHGNEDKQDNSTQELADLYDKAVKSMKDAELKPRGDKRQELYMQSRHLFERASDLVENLNIFSDNETVEDIATADLKYLLIPAFLAKVITSSECGPNRLDTFTKAETYIIRFLKCISQFNLGDEAVEKALERYYEDSCDTDFKVSSTSTTTSLEMAMRERIEKIEQFKKNKQLEDEIADLEARLERCVEGQIDDETIRTYYLNLIRKVTGDMLETLQREVRPAIFFERNRTDHSIANVPSVSSNQKLGQPITIVKNQMQKSVFGIGYPSHPTVTVDEFITKKISDGDLAFNKHKEIYTNSLQRYAEQPDLRRQQEELSDEERDSKEDRDDEEELRRKRKWDEFKDDNPRGSGNRQNMG